MPTTLFTRRVKVAVLPGNTQGILGARKSIHARKDHLGRDGDYKMAQDPRLLLTEHFRIRHMAIDRNDQFS